MANQSVRLKEEQLRREEEKLREIELKVQREIQVKRQELMAKEDSLKVLEARLGEIHQVAQYCGRLTNYSFATFRHVDLDALQSCKSGSLFCVSRMT